MVYTAWVLACLLAGTFVLLYLKEREDHRADRRTSARIIATMHRKLNESRATAAAWEQGIEDQAEIYEQQFLTLNENAITRETQIQLLTEDLRSALALNYIHQTHCLPILDIDSLLAERTAATAESEMNPYLAGYLKDEQEDELSEKVKTFVNEARSSTE